MDLEKDGRMAVYRNAFIKWGRESQINAAFEELGEVIQALAQYQNGKCNLSKLVDEIADARIMLEQIELMYSLELAVHDRIKFKIDRLDQRLKYE